MTTIKKKSSKQLLLFILIFPKIARENNVQGIVEIELVIGTDCEIETINIAKSLGWGCDETALKAICQLAELVKKYDTTRCTGIKKVIPVHFNIE